MTKPKPNKRVTPRAASFKRIAKALRVRASNHKNNTKRLVKVQGESVSALIEATHCSIYTGLASELDNEARTLRAQR